MTGCADSPGDPAGLEIRITLPILGEIEEQCIPDVRTMACHVEELGFDSGGFAGASFWRSAYRHRDAGAGRTPRSRFSRG